MRMIRVAKFVAVVLATFAFIKAQEYRHVDQVHVPETYTCSNSGSDEPTKSNPHSCQRWVVAHACEGPLESAPE
jgi:hypothetical protein